MLRPLARLLYRLTAALSDGVTFQTAHDADVLFGASGGFRRSALVIPGGSGVDLAAFSEEVVSAKARREMRAALGIAPGAPVVTMASRLLYDKGVVEYVEAARAVRARRPDAVFVLAGARDPDNRESVTEEDLAVWRRSGDVLLPGHVSDVPCLLAVSDVVALPTYHEGVPRSLIEAAAMGRAIVATAIPGAAQVVEDGVSGTLVPPRDASALAVAIEALLGDAEMRARYGAAGRRKAEREYRREGRRRALRGGVRQAVGRQGPASAVRRTPNRLSRVVYNGPRDQFSGGVTPKCRVRRPPPASCTAAWNQEFRSSPTWNRLLSRRG